MTEELIPAKVLELQEQGIYVDPTPDFWITQSGDGEPKEEKVK